MGVCGLRKIEKIGVGVKKFSKYAYYKTGENWEKK